MRIKRLQLTAAVGAVPSGQPSGGPVRCSPRVRPPVGGKVVHARPQLSRDPLGGGGMRKRSLVLVALIAASCTQPENTLYPIYRDGRPIRPDPNSCIASVAARRYIYEMRRKVLAAWQPPPGHRGESVVILNLRFDAAGHLKEVYTEPPDNPVKASAVAAFQQAAPFGAVPSEAICLTEEPFQAQFTLERK